ncbi:MAG: DUF6089 family protein [Ferruginibacter sp.]
MKNIRFIVATAILLTAFEQKATAQFYFYDNNYYDTPLMFEVGGSFGLMNCLSDVGGRKGIGKPFIKDLNIGNTHLNGGIYLSALYKYAVGIRLEATFGQVSAYDSILINVKNTTSGRYERNLNFRSKINEVSVVAEFHIRFIIRSFLAEADLNSDDEPPRLSPYIAAGVGFFSFNPQSRLKNNWVDLQPLTLEGQGLLEYPDRKAYKLSQMNIPLGVGFKYDLSPAFNLRAEFLHRFLSTDYLDDVSTRYINKNLFPKYYSGLKLQNAMALSSNDRVNPGGPTGVFRKTEGGIRGNPKDNDAYFTFNIKLGLTFGRQAIRRAGPQRF